MNPGPLDRKSDARPPRRTVVAQGTSMRASFADMNCHLVRYMHSCCFIVNSHLFANFWSEEAREGGREGGRTTKGETGSLERRTIQEMHIKEGFTLNS